jgi:hypothetical protein
VERYSTATTKGVKNALCLPKEARNGETLFINWLIFDLAAPTLGLATTDILYKQTIL